MPAFLVCSGFLFYLATTVPKGGRRGRGEQIGRIQKAAKKSHKGIWSGSTSPHRMKATCLGSHPTNAVAVVGGGGGGGGLFFFCFFFGPPPPPPKGRTGAGPCFYLLAFKATPHSNTGSEPRLRLTPQLKATPDPPPTERGQRSNPHPHGC